MGQWTSSQTLSTHKKVACVPQPNNDSGKVEQRVPVAVVDCHWHPDRLPAPFVDNIGTIQGQSTTVVLTGGCIVYVYKEPWNQWTWGVTGW